MKVREVMREQAVFCGLDTTLAAAVDLMRKNGCGFLPVVGEGGHVIGVITELVQDVILPKLYTFPKLFTCTPDDDIHCVLKTMRLEKIRRLPVINREGALLGILSLDDIMLRDCERAGKRDVSCHDVVEAYQAICAHGKLPTQRQPAA